MLGDIEFLKVGFNYPSRPDIKVAKICLLVAKTWSSEFCNCWKSTIVSATNED